VEQYSPQALWAIEVQRADIQLSLDWIARIGMTLVTESLKKRKNMAENKFRVYGYRWVVLAVFMFVNLTIQVLWIAYAPITGMAASYYGVSSLQIGFLAMVFMIVYIPLSMPVSWMIDTYGFRIGVSAGAVIMGIFGILRGLAGSNYTLVLISTIFLGIAQPFMMNAWTKVAARWFAVEERATAVGLATVANLVGIAIGMALTPVLVEQMSIAGAQVAYGVAAAFSAVLFLVFARENPPTPPCPEGMEARALMLDGLKSAVKVKRFWMFVFVYFVGMGIFNGITTWIEDILRPRGFSPTQAGTLGALLLLGGIVGAFILSTLSDKYHKRQIFILLGVICAVPGVVGMAYATSYWVLVLCAFSIGFFMVSANPVGMQYAAEITYPTPEGTSNGLVSLFGQASVVFVYIMEAMKSADGSFVPAMLFSVGLMGVAVLVITQMKDSAQVPVVLSK
jgi:MFS family permease